MNNEKTRQRKKGRGFFERQNIRLDFQHICWLCGFKHCYQIISRSLASSSLFSHLHCLTSYRLSAKKV